MAKNFVPLVGGGVQMPASAEAVAADIARLDSALGDLAEDVGVLENWDAGDIPYDSSETYDDGTVGAGLNDLKSQIDDVGGEVIQWPQILDLSIHSSTNTAVTYNDDGSITIGTSDYGNTFIGGNVTLPAGKYKLFGVPRGMSFLSTTSSHNTAFVTNETAELKEFTLAETTTCWVGYRSPSKPSASYTIYPGLYQRKSVPASNSDNLDLINGEYYVITPTGDTTDRRAEIANALSSKKAVYFTPGEYTIATKLTMPSGTKLFGAGKSSVINFGSSATGIMIECGNDCQIIGLKLDGGAAEKPANADTNRNGVRVLDNAQTLQMSDCWIVGFEGSGIRVSNTGYAQLSSVQIENCYFQYNGCGIFFMSKGEYGVVSNCSFIDNYIGVYAKGGNNIVSGCALERNTIGGEVDGTSGENTGHGAFIGCSFNHNTNIGLEILNTNNGYLVSGCQFFQDENYEMSVGVPGVNVNGCQFGVSTALRFSGTAFVTFDGCVFAGSPVVSYSDTATSQSSNCFKFDGTPIDILRPGTRSFNNFEPGPMLTIIDDDGHKKFYEDLLPIIQAKKIPITTAIYNSAIGVDSNAMTWAQVEECYEAGAEIVSHSYSHNDSEAVTEMAENEIQYDYQKSRNGLTKRGFVGSKYLVYVGATQSISKVVSAAKNVFACGINSSGNVMNFMGTLDPYNLRRYKIEADYEYDVDDMKGLIDTCLTDGGWMIWMIHTSSAGWDAGAKSAISDCIDYAIAQGLPIVTVEDGCRKMKIYG